MSIGPKFRVGDPVVTIIRHMDELDEKAIYLTREQVLHAVVICLRTTTQMELKYPNFREWPSRRES